MLNSQQQEEDHEFQMEIGNILPASSSGDKKATGESSGEENVPIESLEDDTREISIQALAMEENKIGKLNDNVNDEEGINPEKPNNAEQPGLLAQTESDLSKENRVLRKINRPRYFNPPESGNWLDWNTFDENDKKRKKWKTKKKGKVCYICGDHGHKGKQCIQAKSCAICGKIGHLAMACPNKNAGEDSASQLCLKCGKSSHNMFTCTNDYDPEDLKAIQCYICKNFGHLSCANKTEAPPKVTCYNCGESGHLGQDCTKSPRAILAARTEAAPAKKKKKRGGGKRKKIKPAKTFINALNNQNTWSRPPTLPILTEPYCARPGPNAWLSPQPAAARNHHPDPNPGRAPPNQPINCNAGMHQILDPSVLVYQIPRFPPNQVNQVMVNVHGHEAQIPVNSYTLPHLSYIFWNSQNRPQPPPRVEYRGLQNPYSLSNPGPPHSYQNPYSLSNPGPPHSYRNATLLPGPRTYNTPQPLNNQTAALRPHQMINRQPVPVLPHQISNRPLLPHQVSHQMINRQPVPILPHQISNRPLLPHQVSRVQFDWHSSMFIRGIEDSKEEER